MLACSSGKSTLKTLCLLWAKGAQIFSIKVTWILPFTGMEEDQASGLK